MNYSGVAAPLTRLTCKDKLEWGPQAEKAFQDLKTAFTTAPILVHPDFAKAFYLETDASDFALGALLSQIGVDEKLHPVAFYSRKFSDAEINYEVHDKELLAIVATLSRRRCASGDRIHGSQEFGVLHDGSSLESTTSSVEYVVVAI